MIFSIIQIGPYPVSADCIRGGVESSVYGLVQALIRAEYIVDVFDVPRMGEMDRVERYGNLTIHRYANPGIHNQNATRRLPEIVRDIVALHPDVCHIHGTGTYSRQMYFALQKCGIPTMVTVHGLLQEEKKQALQQKPSLKHLYQYFVQTRNERELLNSVPRVIVDTAYVEDKLRAYKLRHLPEMYIIPQGIDNAYYAIHCDPQSNVLLSVGAISPRKGHIYTIEMFNRLRSRGIEARLRIIGSLADKTYYALLQQKIADSSYASDILLEVNVPREELLKAYASAKLFVLHSREESQGIVFAEAMATGLPVVATNVGGIPYVVENGKSGLLCPFGDVNVMTDMARSLLTDEKKWQVFSVAAKKRANDYNWKAIADKIVQLYMQ